MLVRTNLILLVTIYNRIEDRIDSVDAYIDIYFFSTQPNSHFPFSTSISFVPLYSTLL